MEATNITPEQEAVEEQDITAGSYPEAILLTVVKSYENAFNNLNEKYETQINMTLTTHKVAMSEGNKDVAYLRVERGIREKGKGEEYSFVPVIQEMHVFSGLKERVNPNAPWKEQLFANAVGKLIALGIEYSEFLRRSKPAEEHNTRIITPEKPEIIVTDQMPKPLTTEDEDYKKWLAEERKKEGL